MAVTHLNQVELSRRWKLSHRTLERWRWLGRGPRYVKIGGRVVYRIVDIEAYEAALADANLAPQSREFLEMKRNDVAASVSAIAAPAPNQTQRPRNIRLLILLSRIRFPDSRRPQWAAHWRCRQRPGRFEIQVPASR